jgi:hypothetical protein
MKSTLYKLSPIAFLPLILPSRTYAYSSDLQGLSEYLIEFAKTSVLWLIFALAVIFFLWNILMMLKNPDKIKERKFYILWGLVALTVMFTIYSIVGLFAETFNFDVGIPQFFVGQSGN